MGSEEIIDTLYEGVREKVKKKPKTYRNLARKDYLKVAKKRRPRRKERRKGIKKQLQYIKRNLTSISWDNFNEAGDLKTQIETFKSSTGVYPESVHVDRIYRTRSNGAFCKERGIRMSGPPLGRPPANVSPSKKKQALEDERIRNGIEGKFGISKRRYGLNRVMAKLPHTSETAIAITFLVLNLGTLLRQVFCVFLLYFSKNHTFLAANINYDYDGGIVNKKSSSLFQS